MKRVSASRYWRVWRTDPLFPLVGAAVTLMLGLIIWTILSAGGA